MMTEDVRTEDGGAGRARLRTLLEAEYDRLVDLRRAVGGDVLEEIDSMGQELSSADQHPADSGTELEDRERDQSLLERLDRQLRDVDDALGRLDRGEYGLCEVCAQPIGEARLEALPATRFCLAHQAMAEREVGRSGASGDEARSVTPL
jgi:RNA polymerase-binding transcription factor DksA